MIKVLIFLLLSINLNAYEPDKPDLYLNPASFYKFDNSFGMGMNSYTGSGGGSAGGNSKIPKEKPPTFREDSLELIQKLMESDDYNIVIDDQSFINLGEDAFQKIKTEILDKLQDSSKITLLKDMSPQLKQVFQKKMGSTDSLPVVRYGDQSNKEVFFNLYNSVKNRESLWRMNLTPSSLLQDSELSALVYDLGGASLNKEFNLKDIEISIFPSNGSKTCSTAFKNKSYEFSLDTCIEHFLETEKRWGDQGQCHLYKKSTKISLKRLAKIECEPERIQSFMNYIEDELITVCDDAFQCKNNVVGKSFNDLSLSLEKILIFNRLREIEKVTRKDESHDFYREIDQLIEELSSFNQNCRREEGTLELGLTEDLDKKVNEIEREIEFGFDSFMNLEESKKKEVKNKTLFAFKFCLYKNQNGLEDPRKDTLKQCKRESFNSAMEDLIKELAQEKPNQYSKRKFFLEDKAKSFCHYGLKEDRLKEFTGMSPMISSSSPLNSFDFVMTGDDSLSFPYDLKRCTSYLKEQSSLYESLKRKEQISLTPYVDKLDLQSDPSRVEGLINTSFKRCTSLKREGEVLICKNQVINEVKAQLLLEAFFNGDDTEGVARLPNHSKDLVNQAKTNKVLNQCLGQSSDIKRENCFAAIKEQYSYFFINPYSKFEDAGSALSNDLAKMTKKLTRDISVFHWGADELTGNDNNEPAPLTSFKAYKYVVAREFMFHTGPLLDKIVEVPGATLAGRGLYAASDPNSSSNYGPTLVEIEVPKGSVVLDLREANTHGKIPISKDTYNKLMASGCDLERLQAEAKKDQLSLQQLGTTSQSVGPSKPNEPARFADFADPPLGSPFYLFVGKTIFEQNRACHSALQTAVKKLGLNVMAYNYGHQLPAFCDKENHAANPAAAFVMVDNKMRGNITTYNAAAVQKALKEHKEEGTPIPEKIRRLLQIHNSLAEDSTALGAYGVGDNFRADSSLDSINYWKPRLFNCDHQNEEDSISGGLIPKGKGRGF